MFEHYSEDILTPPKWYVRIFKSFRLAGVMLAGSLLVGISGYHWLGKLGWLDAFLESAMILGGMGPVAAMTNDYVKVFAGIYALYSGLVLVSISGILLAPWLHRLMHHFYYQPKK